MTSLPDYVAGWLNNRDRSAPRFTQDLMTAQLAIWKDALALDFFARMPGFARPPFRPGWANQYGTVSWDGGNMTQTLADAQVVLPGDCSETTPTFRSAFPFANEPKSSKNALPFVSYNRPTQLAVRHVNYDGQRPGVLNPRLRGESSASAVSLRLLARAGLSPLETGSDVEAMNLQNFLARPSPTGTYTLVQGCEVVEADEAGSCWWNGLAFLEVMHALVDSTPGSVKRNLDFMGTDFVHKRARFHFASQNIFRELRDLQQRGYGVIQNFEPGLDAATCNATDGNQMGVRYQFNIDEIHQQLPRLAIPGHQTVNIPIRNDSFRLAAMRS